MRTPLSLALRSLLSVAALAPCAAHAQAGGAQGDLVETLLSQMTLEEKAGQLSQIGAQQTPTGPRVAGGSDDDVRRGRIGSLLGVSGAQATRKLQRIAVEESRLHIPLLFAFDVLHGFRTVFPVPLAEAASFDLELAERTARVAGREAATHGVHWTYAPMVDVARDPRWGRVVEGSGEDPFLGAALAAARVRGFRGGSVADATTVLSTAKHFAGYGGAEGGRDYDAVEISERTLREIYLPPFRAAVEAGTDAIMPAFHELGGVPMHAHEKLLRDMVRGEWGFRGLFVSDYTAVQELIMHGIAGTPEAATTLAMEASVDVDMMSNFYASHLPALVRSGRIAESALDDAVRRVLAAKQRLGLFEDPYRFSDATREEALAPSSRALAREAAQKSIVLLKNERGLLPLRKDLRTLAVIGALATDAQATLGAWAGVGRAEDTITVLAGLRAAVSPSTRVLYAPGASPTSDDRSGLDEAARVAKEADAVVVVIGESEEMTGEAHNRASLGLPGAQEALLERLRETGKPLVLVLMNGRPLALSATAEQAPALLEAWYLGHEMGHAVADVVFGDVSPSGKLPMTFPRSVGQVPIYYNRKQSGRPPREDERYSSKYLDLPWTPLYPFGYGLSYTTFAYDKPQLSATRIGPRDVLRVRVRVRNTGPRAGDEVVQLYLRDEVASITRPVRALRGFRRISLPKGATREVTFSLDENDFALLDGDYRRVVEPGRFTVYVGGSSLDTQHASFEITEGATLPGLGPAIPLSMRGAYVKKLAPSPKSTAPDAGPRTR